MNWKYKILNLNRMPPDNDSALNRLGSQGWELVCIDSGLAYLKAQMGPEMQYVAPSADELMEKIDKVMISLGGVRNQS